MSSATQFPKPKDPSLQYHMSGVNEVSLIPATGNSRFVSLFCSIFNLS
jgi:hypothetical protein